jgi:hypothetical protein
MDIGAKLELILELVGDWKMSSARGGARSALAVAKAHYPELDLDIITSEFPKVNVDGTPVDEAAIWQAVLGYDHMCALGTNLAVFYKRHLMSDSPSSAGTSAIASDAPQGNDGGDDVSSTPTAP